MTEKPYIVHSTFSIERTYPTSVDRVFHAFADQETKRRWFAEGEGWEVDEYTADFRVGGREFSRFRYQGGPEIINETLYLDIVPKWRIVFAYRMAVADSPISASLATVQFEPVAEGVRVTFTEQGAYFDSPDAPRGREEGSRELFEALARELGVA